MEKSFGGKFKGIVKVSITKISFVNNSFSTSDSVNCLFPTFTFVSIFDFDLRKMFHGYIYKHPVEF